MEQKLHDDQSVKAGADIVEHDTHAFRKPLKSANREGLGDVERTKKYKGCKNVVPIQWDVNECDKLSGNFVDDHLGRIFAIERTGNS
jgi:hypothetical protein